jgi:hypothetical protein
MNKAISQQEMLQRDITAFVDITGSNAYALRSRERVQTAEAAAPKN